MRQGSNKVLEKVLLNVCSGVSYYSSIVTTTHRLTTVHERDQSTTSRQSIA